MLRSFYRWTMNLAGGRHAEKALALIAFSEASFFPIPPDVMLAPMVLARQERAWRYALVCSAASVLGAFLGYFIGYSLQGVGLTILNFFGSHNGMEAYRSWFAHYGFGIILLKGVTPIPFKITTIAAGLAKYSLIKFFVACTITRSARFFLVAFLLKRFGPEITAAIEKRIYLVSAIVLAVIVLGILGFFIVKLLAK